MSVPANADKYADFILAEKLLDELRSTLFAAIEEGRAWRLHLGPVNGEDPRAGIKICGWIAPAKEQT
jgi:hypothetical protein